MAECFEGCANLPRCPHAEGIAKATVRETFAVMGIDVDDPAELRTLHANFAFVYRLRKMSERVGATVIVVVVTAITGGILGMIWKSLGGKS